MLSVWRSQPKAAAKRVGHAPQVSQRQGIETAKIDEGPLEGHACSITGTQDGKWRQCSFKNSILSILASLMIGITDLTDIDVFSARWIHMTDSHSQ